jgi:hypothetical protein
MSFIILSNDGKKVAIQNEKYSGVFELREPLQLEEEARIKYLDLPTGARKVASGCAAVNFFTDSLWRETPTEGNWQDARENSQVFRNEDEGYWLERWWVGKTIDGEEFPCRRADFISYC